MRTSIGWGLLVLGFLGCTKESQLASSPSPQAPASELPAAQSAPSEQASASAAPPATAAPTPLDLAVFAEGWGLQLGDVRGTTVLFDLYRQGVAQVQGDAIKLLVGRDSDLPAEHGLRITAITGWWPQSAWATVQQPGRFTTLYRWGRQARWQPGPVLMFDTFVNMQLAPAATNYTVALLQNVGAKSGLLPIEREGATPLSLTLSDSRTRPVQSLFPLQVRGLASGEVLVLGSHNRLSGRGKVSLERWAPGAEGSTLSPVPELFAVSEPADSSLCVGAQGQVSVVRDVLLPDGGHWQSKAYAASLHGTEWTLSSELPESTLGWVLAGCAITPDGALWTAFNDYARRESAHIYRLSPEGQWLRVVTPALSPVATQLRFERSGKPATWSLASTALAPEQRKAGVLQITGLRASEDGTLWLEGKRFEEGALVTVPGLAMFEPARTVVLRSGPSPKTGPHLWESVTGSNVLDAELAYANGSAATSSTASSSAAPPSAPPETTAPGVQPPAPALPLVAFTPQCTSIFVQLYTVSPQAPADYDFPQTREALRSHPELSDATFVEAEVEGKRIFGAIVPSEALAKQLQAVIRKQVRGSRPQILCGRPTIRRSVPMGLGRKSAAMHP